MGKRVDLAIVAGLVVVTFFARAYGPNTAPAVTATEYLQSWRYGIPHEITDWTNPQLAEYAMAAGISIFGDDKATGAGFLNSPITDAAFEPAYEDPETSGTGGDRIFLTTGSWLLIAQGGQLGKASGIAIPGAVAVAVDTAGHQVFVGTIDGEILAIPSTALDAMASSNATVKPTLVGHVAAAISHLWATGASNVIVQAGDDVSLLDVATGSTLATLYLPGVAGLLPLDAGGRHLAVAAVPSGLIELDATTLQAMASIPLTAGATGLALVGLPNQPTLYVATGAARIEMLSVGSDASLTDLGGFAMPGLISDVRWDRATNMVHVLGQTREGAATVYVVEPTTNSIFADAALPFAPTAWVLDAQANDQGTDRQRVLAFAQTGVMVSVDAGGNAFGWRLPGAVAAALLAGLLYLLGVVLFRRRWVGVVLAVLAGVLGFAGLLDSYVAVFGAAAFAVLVYMLGSRAVGWRALTEGLLLPVAIGLLFGLAIASSWLGLYAMVGAALVVLLRSRIGRWLALAGLVGLTGAFGVRAVSDNSAAVGLLALMAALVVVLGVGIVRAGGVTRPVAGEGPRWVDPGWRFGIPFMWAMAAMLLVPFAVYVASYIPWALSTAGDPRLILGWPAGHTGQAFLDLQSAMYQNQNANGLPNSALWTLAVLVAMAAVSAVAMLRARPRRERKAAVSGAGTTVPGRLRRVFPR